MQHVEYLGGGEADRQTQKNKLPNYNFLPLGNWCLSKSPLQHETLAAVLQGELF